MTNARTAAARGFTLIELMVTLAIAAVLMLVAVPNLVSFQRNAELTSLTNGFIAALGAAKGEAMKRNAYALVVPADGASWTSGWRVYVDTDLSKDFDATKDVTVLQRPALADYMSVTGTGVASGTTPYVMFDASGYSKTKAAGFDAPTLTLARNDVTGSTLLEQTRKIKIANTGRVYSCKPASTTDPNC